MLVGCKALSNSDFPIQKVRWLIAASLSTSGQEILYAINKSSVLEHKIILYWWNEWANGNSMFFDEMLAT